MAVTVLVKLIDGGTMRVTAPSMDAVKQSVETQTWVKVTETDDNSVRWVQVSNIVWIMPEPKV